MSLQFEFVAALIPAARLLTLLGFMSPRSANIFLGLANPLPPLHSGWPHFSELVLRNFGFEFYRLPG